MRIGANLDSYVAEFSEQLKPLAKEMATRIYEDVYREGYADGREDCAEESVKFLGEEETE